MSTQSNISADGQQFLKIATASPDFENLAVEGIPDEHGGPTFVKKDFVYTTVNCPDGQSTFIIVTPSAGVSHYTTSYPLSGGSPTLPPGGAAATLNGHIYPDAPTLFPGCGESEAKVSNSTQVSAGRLMSMSCELQCLNNAFNQYGSITCVKTPLRLDLIEVEDTGDNFTQLRIMGALGCFQPLTSSEASVTPVRDGAYSVSMNREAEFSFYNVRDDIYIDYTYPAYVQNNTGSDPSEVLFKGPAPLWDNGFDSVCYRIDVPSGAEKSQSFILKTWKAWEFQPVANSLVHSIAHASPPINRATIDTYHEIERLLPVSVPARDNPDFWDRVLRGLAETSEVTKGIPFVGKTAKGAHAIAYAIDRIGRASKARKKKKKKKGEKKKKKKKK